MNMIKIDANWENINGNFVCPYCDKEYSKKGISTHIWRNHISNDKNWGGGPLFKGKKGNTPWNKGKTKNTNSSLTRASTKLKKKVAGINNPFFGKNHSDESKASISEKLSKNNNGGRCKWFKAKRVDGTEFYVQGTWEFRFSRILNLLDNKWIKIGINDAKHSFKWEDDLGNLHTYTPDFWCPTLEKYFEVKGYWWGNDKIKMKKVFEQNILNLEIIEKKKLLEYENWFLSSVGRASV